MKTANGTNLIDMSDLTDLELLKTNVIYADEYESLNKERQAEIYSYCKLHATHEICRDNLVQIRYAVTKTYFGW